MTELQNDSNRFLSQNIGVPFKTFDKGENIIVYYILVVCSPILIVFGTIGNAIVITVLSRRRMRQATSSFFLILLAVVDLMVLNLGLMRDFIRALTDLDIRKFSQVGCKVHIFLVYFCRHFSAWILVAVAVERFISVWFPFNAKAICTHRNGTIALSIIAVVLTTINSHFFWTFSDDSVFCPTLNETVHYYCVHKEEFEHFFLKVWPWLEASLNTYGPFTMMLLCNTLIIGRIVHAHLERKRQQVTVANIASVARMTTMTAMLLAATFTFLILTTPASLYMIGQSSWWENDHRYNPKFEIFWAIAQQLSYMNNAINFIIYFISGPIFRNELIIMCRGLCTRTHVSPGN